MLSSDAWENLTRYYAWDRANNPSDVGYPHVDPVRRLLGGSIGSEGLSDDEAMFIDKALCLLKRDDPEGYAIVKRVHRDGKTLRWMEKRGEGNRRTNGYKLKQAHTHIQAFIQGIEYHKESGVATS